MPQLVLASSRRKAQHSVAVAVVVCLCFTALLAYYVTPAAQLSAAISLSTAALFLALVFPTMLALIYLLLSRYVQVTWDAQYLVFRKPFAFGSTKKVFLAELKQVTLKNFKGSYFRLEYQTGPTVSISVDFLTGKDLADFASFLQAQAITTTNF